MSAVRNTPSIFTTVILLVAMSVLAGCAPRGETKTLDEILQLARERYQQALAGGIDGDLNTELTQLTSNLDGILSGDSVPTRAGDVEVALRVLTGHVGFTTRPAMGEIIDQYALASKEESSEQRRKLLVSRTYRLLARELETTRFRL